MLPPRHRLRRAADLAHVRRAGRRWQSGLFILIVASQQDDASSHPTRFAFVAGRRIGNAVVRNRSKRRMREIVRHQLPRVVPGYDCMMIARPAVADASFTQMEAEAVALLSRANLFSTDRPWVVSN